MPLLPKDSQSPVPLAYEGSRQGTLGVRFPGCPEGPGKVRFPGQVTSTLHRPISAHTKLGNGVESYDRKQYSSVSFRAGGWIVSVGY